MRSSVIGERNKVSTEPVQSSALSVRPDTAGPPVPAFLLGAQERRLGGAMGASVISHFAAVGLLALVISLAPEPVYELFVPDRTNYDIVWIAEEGPGGGGGGGGNESLELPPEIEVKGEDPAKLSVPVEKPPELVQPDPRQEPPLTSQSIRIPAVPMATAPENRVGLLEGLTALGPTDARGSGVGGGAGAGQGAGVGPGLGSGLGPGIGGGTGGGYYRPGAGIINPRPLLEVKPKYTAEAMRARLQGSVWLEAIVLADGTVGDVRITKSLDKVFGLDEEAIKASKQWQFIPGMRNGSPVNVLVVIELSFTLR